MACSINTLKSHMFFTCKNFMFSDFTWKKIILLLEMVRGLAPPASLPTAPAFPAALDQRTNIRILDVQWP